MPRRRQIDPPDASELLLNDPAGIAAALTAIDEGYDAARPDSTKQAYNGKIKEWKQWCERCKFDDGDYVRADKLATFLETEVKGREHRKRGAVKGRKPGKRGAVIEAPPVIDESDSEAEEEEQVVGVGAHTGKEIQYATVEAYISAMVNLYNDQLSARLHNYAHPRDNRVKKFLATYRLTKNAREKRDFVDRGIGTFADGYGPGKTIADLVDTHFLRNNTQGLRDRLVSLFCHHAILRGENARNLQLADLQSVELSANEGPTRATALVLVIKNGKRNQTGKLEMAGMMRHRDWEACPQGGLAFYLFDRFHIQTHNYPPANLSFPSFESPQLWYPIYLFIGKSPFEPISYETHLAAETAALKAAGINSTKKTHFQRGSAAREADMGGATTDDLRRHGRWENQQSIMHSYLTNLPRTLMRVLAGFSANPGSYFLARDIEPPKELMEQLWPDADEWLQRHKTATCTPNLAAVGFLTLLLHLRRVFLQDAVFLQVKYPDLFLFNHELFGSPEWKTWSTKLLRHLTTVDDPTEMQLERAMPHQLEYMKAQHGDNIKHHLENGSVLEEILETVLTIRGNQDRMEDVLRELLTGGAYVVETEEVTRKKRMHVVFDGDGDGVSNVHAGASRSTREESQDLPTLPFSRSTAPTYSPTTAPSFPSTNRSPAASPSSRHPSHSTSPIRNQLSTSQRFHAFLHPSSSTTAATTSYLSTRTDDFEMSRTVKTVVDLWREYDEGLNGRPSVKAMLAANWKMAEKERKFWERRKNIIEGVKRLNQDGVSLKQAATLLEERRRAGNLQLNAFDKKLKAEST